MIGMVAAWTAHHFRGEAFASIFSVGEASEFGFILGRSPVEHMKLLCGGSACLKFVPGTQSHPG